MPTRTDGPVEYTITVTGDYTKHPWFGKFQAKTLLSHKDRLNRDRLRREYLGVRPEEASPEAKASAVVFSELAVRLAKWPAWWEASDMGMDLKDMNLVGDVYKGALKIEDDYLAEMAKEAEEAKKAVAQASAEMEPASK